MSQLVITAVGSDRPGLVDAFTGFLHDAGANIADSRMINLRGQFAILILVEADSDDVIRRIANEAVDAGNEVGLEVRIAGDKSIETRMQGQPYRVKVFAMDQLHFMSNNAGIIPITVSVFSSQQNKSHLLGSTKRLLQPQKVRP